MEVFWANSEHNFRHSLLVVFQSLIKGILFGGVGLGFLGAAYLLSQANSISWWKMAVAFPLGLLGATIILLALYKIMAAILDRRYSKTHCLICEKAVKVSLDEEF